MASSSDFCVVGLGTMGRNLARNLARRGLRVLVYSRFAAELATAPTGDEPGGVIRRARSPAEVAAALERPRKVLLLVKAGEPVDELLAQLTPVLEPGDLILDGGNSHPDDTERRAAELQRQGLRFLGMGISGGAEGALWGPSLMPGGAAEAYALVEPILRRIAAPGATGPCVTHVGTGAAGHFVKVVHNGIEYGDMQLLAEAFDLLRHGLGRSPATIADQFAAWNEGELESYLLGITPRILRTVDEATGEPLVDRIRDAAAMKGSGQWAAELALRFGVPTPTIHAAVQARLLSTHRLPRGAAREEPPPPAPDADGLLEDLRRALHCARICGHLQGLELITAADRERSWGIDLRELTRIWQGGCILRSRLMRTIHEALLAGQGGGPPEHPLFATLLSGQHAPLRRVVASGAACGVPMLAFTGSLAWLDSIRRSRLPQNLTQAQRDLFGQHGFERVDRAPGELFHHRWPDGPGPDGPAGR